MQPQTTIEAGKRRVTIFPADREDVLAHLNKIHDSNNASVFDFDDDSIVDACEELGVAVLHIKFTHKKGCK